MSLSDVEKLKRYNKMKKIAFVCLTRGYLDIKCYDDIIYRNNCIKPYLDEYNAKNIIFHEGNITSTQQTYIVNQSCNTEFVNLQEIDTKAFRDVGKLEPSDIIYETERSMDFNIGYRHMCHFWLVDFLHILKDYEYIVRVDEDCFLQSFPNNLFNNDFVFITPHLYGPDCEVVTVGLQHTLDNFNKMEGTIETFKVNQCTRNPYTNVFVLNIQKFLNNDLFAKYVKHIDSTNGIYINRWGDLPLMGYFLQNYVPQKDYLLDRRISYVHKSHDNRQINRVYSNNKLVL